MNSAKSIDRNTPIPLYFQLKQIVRGEIEDGYLRPDDMIPTEKELSERYDLSRTTVRQAIQELTQEGLLYRVKVKGTFVARAKDNQSFIQRLKPFDDHIRETGKTPSTEIISCQVVPMPVYICQELQCPRDSKAIELLRVRYADDEPVVYVQTYMPYERCRCLLDDGRDLRHLYVSMSNYRDLKVYKVLQTYEAVTADVRDVRYLKVKKNYPIQLISIIAYTKEGVAVEYSSCRVRGDRNKFQCVVLADES